MRYWTWGEIREKIMRDLDLEDETFITQDEMLGYGNEAVDEAESEIHTLYEDYFLKDEPLTLVSGTDSYDMPEDIYAMKLKELWYQNGSRVYEIKELKPSKRLGEFHLRAANPSAATTLDYFVKNSVVGSPKIVMVPAPQESGAYVTVWYLRNANRFLDDDSICDIPEFAEFVIQYVKVRCYEKEGHPNLPLALAALEQHRQQMNATLAQKSASGANEIEADFSHYEEHS